MNNPECVSCGLTAADLIAPDMLDESEAEAVFTHEGGQALWEGCVQLPPAQRLSGWG
ncbi:hypothetical protein ACWDUL_38410 [Nocardia niigatensis]